MEGIHQKPYQRKQRVQSFCENRGFLWRLFFLVLLCCTLYNVWHYDVVRCQTENGNYHARLTGALDEGALERIQNYSNVESVVVEDAVVDSEEPAEEKTVDILLKDVSSAYEDLPRIASLAGLREEDITYHEELLNLYFVVNPDNPDSADAYAVLVVFAAAGVLSCFSLITIIRHAYAVYMNDKIHELGILASVGAAPGQLRKGLLKEAFALSALPAVSRHTARHPGKRGTDRVDGCLCGRCHRRAYGGSLFAPSGDSCPCVCRHVCDRVSLCLDAGQSIEPPDTSGGCARRGGKGAEEGGKTPGF